MTQITDRLQYLNELESRGRPGWKNAAFFLDRSPKWKKDEIFRYKTEPSRPFHLPVDLGSQECCAAIALRNIDVAISGCQNDFSAVLFFFIKDFISLSGLFQ